MLTFVAVVVGLLGLVSTARAQEKKNGAPLFGHVDVAQVLNESKARQKDVAELTQMASGLNGVLESLQNVNARFLAEAEIKELAVLYEKANKTDADKKRITALEDSGNAKAARKRNLENTANPTDEQQQQFGQLRETEEKGLAVMKAINDDFSKRINARQVELNNKTVSEIKAVIAKIAQDKGLSAVFDSQVAIWTANDITQDVIKQINK
ncbi:MAG: OmpH family outer membrane protein [Capsulimonadales bacterium]|nr:OmpH family outer membrane protein [Capsulimonadales bacterium]